MAKKMTSETILKSQIKELAPHIGLKIWSIGGSLGQVRGLPDYFGIHMGRPIAIETKSPKGKMSHHQIDFRDKWCAAGGIHIEARKLEDITDGLGIKGLLWELG